MPRSKQAWPNRAACWSPTMALTGTPARGDDAAEHRSGHPSEPAARRAAPRPGPTSGRRTGRRARPTSAGPRCRRAWSARRWSRRWRRRPPSVPPVRFHSTQVSTVASARSGPAGTPPSSSSHCILERREVRVEDQAGPLADQREVPGRGRVRRTRSAVRRSCQTSARCRGAPVDRSQATTVSRWLVTPIDRATRPASAESAGHLGQGVAHQAPDLVGVVLDPARAREVLGQLPVGDVHHPGLLVDDQGPDAGGAGVDGDADGGAGGHRGTVVRSGGPGDAGRRVAEAPAGARAQQ